MQQLVRVRAHARALLRARARGRAADGALERAQLRMLLVRMLRTDGDGPTGGGVGTKEEEEGRIDRIERPRIAIAMVFVFDALVLSVRSQIMHQ